MDQEELFANRNASLPRHGHNKEERRTDLYSRRRESCEAGSCVAAPEMTEISLISLCRPLRPFARRRESAPIFHGPILLRVAGSLQGCGCCCDHARCEIERQRKRDERNRRAIAGDRCRTTVFSAHGIAEEKLVWFTVATGGVARGVL